MSGASSGEPLGCYFFHCKDTWQTCRKPCIFNVSFICTYNPGMIFFSYLTDFSYFSVKMKFRNLQDTVRTGQKWHFWNGCRLFQLPYSLSRIIPDNSSCFRQECFISKGRCLKFIKKKKNSDQDIAEILLRLELNPNQSIDQCIFITVSHNKR